MNRPEGNSRHSRRGGGQEEQEFVSCYSQLTLKI